VNGANAVNTEDLLWRINELYEQHSGEASFWERIARIITEETGQDFTKDMVRGRWRRQSQSSESPQKEKQAPQSDPPPDLTINTDGISSVDELIAKSGIDMDVFDVERFILNVWDGKEQVKVWLKRKTPDPFSQNDFLEKIDDVVSRHLSSRPAISRSTPAKEKTKEHLFIPVIFDAHIDSPTFRVDYVDVLERLVELGIGAGYHPAQVLYVVGNDFGHIDNAAYSTTAGTLVGSSRTYLDSVDERCSVLLKASEFLRNCADKLDIVGVPGNHDRFSTYWLSRVLSAYYRNDRSVSVHNGQSPRKYYRYGKTLFGLTHGNEEKSYDMASLMAVESPMDWAMSERRIWLTGHLHQQRRTYNMLNERYGVVQRIFPSLVEPDDWHVLKGYIGMDVAAQLLVYDLNGPVAEFHLSVR
jgi:hypothetical protein